MQMRDSCSGFQGECSVNGVPWFDFWALSITVSLVYERGGEVLCVFI